MKTATSLLAALALLPQVASANGGSAGTYEAQTSGAMAGAHPGPLVEAALVQDDDVECLSERLAIALNGDQVAVQVDYVFVNRGATKTLRYAFPFALGQDETLVGSARKVTRRYGEPASYAITVDGKPVKAEQRAGALVPPEIPTPRIDDTTPSEAAPGTTKTRYRWDYRVSSITFPTGVERRVRVNYTTPYLVYMKRSELGHAMSPGEFSYILSTGGQWRGGTIGSLKIRVASEFTPLAQIQIDGLPFKRERTAWSFEATDFKPTTSSNLVVRRSELTLVELQPGEGVPENVVREIVGLLGAGWLTPPVGGKVPVRIELLVGEAADRGASEVRARVGGRFRLGLAFGQEAGAARLTRARVEVAFQEHEPEIFHATFAKVDPRDVTAAGGYRSIWFDADEAPTTITIIPVEVEPGAKGERRLRIDHIMLHQDISNYDAHVATPR
ncbi:MAG TPA: DUF4424 family protein [Anaeromyxobacteraceae bacterium]|nr:DUF4424 family protein [Anaeromyxobacteraceae bacterium]